MKLKQLFSLTVVAIAFGSAGGVAYADEASPKPVEHAQHHSKAKTAGKELSPEMRQKMAEMHQMMADCLKTEKPMSECKQEMMKNCPMMKDSGHCPMVGEVDEMGEMMGHTKGSAKKAVKSEEHNQHHPQ